VGEDEDADQALQAARRLRPELIITSAELTGVPISSLVRRLHANSPESQVLVLGDEVYSDAAYQLTDPAASYVVWRDLTTLLVPIVCLAAAAPELTIESAALLRDLLAPGAAKGWPGVAKSMTRLEAEVLSSLASGENETEIANTNGLSRRRVQEVVAGLKRKFEAPTLFVLGMRARDLRI
jgi:DNA-binding NarL/FixJ family response regulator